MNKKLSRILYLIDLLLIAAQTVIAAFFTKGSSAALMQLAEINRVRETGAISPAAPISGLWGLICRVTGCSVTLLVLHILPLLIIPACYLIYFLLVRAVSKETAPFALFLICLMQIYGYQSERFLPATLLLSWFSGTALLVHLLLPGLLLAAILRIEKNPERCEITCESEEDEEEMNRKIINVRNLSIAFVLFAILAIGAILVLNRKINSLHDATASLQTAVDGKGDFIEFRGATGDALKGYLLVGAEDGVTVIFGGEERDGEALFALITEYSDHVDSWYLRQDNDNGAYEYCKVHGIAVDRVYHITGIDEVE